VVGLRWFLFLLAISLVIMLAVNGLKNVIASVTSAIFISAVARVVAKYAD